MQAWMPDIPRNPNTAILDPANPLSPHGAVTHRTIGHWAGDLAVLTRSRVPSCHFLVGEDEGQWTQMVPVNVVANHAAGANGYAVGIEVSGQNGSAFTPWQITAVSKIVAFLTTCGVPLHRYNGSSGRLSDFHGFIDHLYVATTPDLEHFDYWNPADWDAVSTITPPSPPVEETDPMPWSFLTPDDKTGELFVLGPFAGALYCNSGQLYTDLQNQAQVFGQKNVETRKTPRSVIYSLPRANPDQWPKA